MSLSASQLWNAWRDSSKIREIAEAWLTKSESWGEDDERLYQVLYDEPERGLAVLFAAMQLTDDVKLLSHLAAGPVEDFLGRHGEAYLDTIHSLALEHRRLREVLGGVWQGSMSKRVWRRIEVLQQRGFSKLKD